ncbi:hypothetical protein MRX96_036332 [Rhipicephalus microplus]
MVRARDAASVLRRRGIDERQHYQDNLQELDQGRLAITPGFWSDGGIQRLRHNKTDRENVGVILVASFAQDEKCTATKPVLQNREAESPVLTHVPAETYRDGGVKKDDARTGGNYWNHWNAVPHLHDMPGRLLGCLSAVR